jgi:hypothetical protein
LPLADFAFNNTPSATTGVSPFFANKGYHLNISINPKYFLASARAHELAVNLSEIHEYLKENIQLAQQGYQGPADNCQTPPLDFKIGDRVFVKAKFFKTTRPSPKLLEKYLGPFKIIAQPSPQSFTLRLLTTMCNIHPVYHVSMPESHTPSEIPNRTPSPSSPVEIEGKLEYELEVLNSKIDCHQKEPLLYKVRWLGYKHTDKEFDWLPASELSNTPEAVAKFQHRYPNKLGPM